MQGCLRVVTYNFWGLTEPLEQRLEHAIRQLSALQPDVIGIQEVRPVAGKDGHTTAHRMAEALSMECLYSAALEWDEGTFGPTVPAGAEGLAILSRHPIRDHHMIPLPEARPSEARILLSALIDGPGAPVWFHTTHLHWRLDDGVARENQVAAVDAAVRAIEGDYLHILVGDFNATHDCDEIRFLCGKHTLAGRRTHYQDAWQHAHPDEHGYTWSMANPHTGPFRSLDFDRRIDYVFVSTRRRDGRGTIRDARVVLDQPDDAGVCASDHYGVLADIQVVPDRP